MPLSEQFANSISSPLETVTIRCDYEGRATCMGDFSASGNIRRNFPQLLLCSQTSANSAKCLTFDGGAIIHMTLQTVFTSSEKELNKQKYAMQKKYRRSPCIHIASMFYYYTQADIFNLESVYVYYLPLTS